MHIKNSGGKELVYTIDLKKVSSFSGRRDARCGQGSSPHMRVDVEGGIGSSMLRLALRILMRQMLSFELSCFCCASPCASLSLGAAPLTHPSLSQGAEAYEGPAKGKADVTVNCTDDSE